MRLTMQMVDEILEDYSVDDDVPVCLKCGEECGGECPDISDVTYDEDPPGTIYTTEDYLDDIDYYETDRNGSWYDDGDWVIGSDI